MTKEAWRLVCVALIVVSAMLSLLGSNVPNWKLGLSCLLLAIVTAIDSYFRENSEFARVSLATFSLGFLVLSIGYFLA